MSFSTPSCFNDGTQELQTDNLSNITNKSFPNSVQKFITFCWMDSVALVSWGGAHTRSSHQVVTKARVAKCHTLDIYTLKLTILLDFERIIDFADICKALSTNWNLTAFSPTYIFLAVQDSSIGDLVTHSLTHSLSHF